jgi:protein O-GlcNAc transferase
MSLPFCLAIQTIFKLDPLLDTVTQKILQADPKAVLLFKEPPTSDRVGTLVMRRLRRTLSEAEISRVFFLPQLSETDYANAYLITDVIIDSYPFGGHTTTMDAFTAGVPVVTLPTEYLSGRCTQGLLRLIGLEELIAKDSEDWIRIIIAVGSDAIYRHSLSTKILQGVKVLKRHTTSVDAWQELLVDIGEGRRPKIEWYE